MILQLGNSTTPTHYEVGDLVRRNYPSPRKHLGFGTYIWKFCLFEFRRRRRIMNVWRLTDELPSRTESIGAYIGKLWFLESRKRRRIHMGYCPAHWRFLDFEFSRVLVNRIINYAALLWTHFENCDVFFLFTRRRIHVGLCPAHWPFLDF